MFGELIALSTALCWSIGIFPFTEASKRLGAAPLNQYRLLLAWAILSAVLLFFYPVSLTGLFTRPKFNQYLFLGLSGIIGFTIGDYFMFSSFKHLGPKLASLYFTLAPGAALLAGFLILDQKINFIGVAGIFITTGGVIWLTLSKKDKRSSREVGFARSPAGAIYGIIGALCQGTGLVVSKLGIDAYNEKLPTIHAVWIRLLFAFGAAFLISAVTGQIKKNATPVFKNQNNGLPYLVAGTIFGPVLGVSLSLLAIQHMAVAAAQTIFALVPVLVLPMNYMYYKEKITVQALISCLIAILGVFILIWRDTIEQWI